MAVRSERSIACNLRASHIEHPPLRRSRERPDRGTRFAIAAAPTARSPGLGVQTMQHRTKFATTAAPRAAVIAAAFATVASSFAFTRTARAADVDVVGLTARDVATGLSLGTFTSVDLVKAFQDRITAYEPNYNA